MIYTLTLNPAVDREYRVDELILDEVLRALDVRNDPGGKGFNVSRMVAQLGGETTAVGIVGGASGTWLAEEMERAGVIPHFLEIDQPTRINTTVVSEKDGRYLKVNGAGPTLSQDHIDQLMSLVQSLARPGDWWVLAGSLPRSCPPSIYARLIEHLHAAGSHVFLDTSGEPLQLGCLTGPDWIKPNLSEAMAITNSRDAEAAGHLLHHMGVGHVVVSQGKDGALLFSEEGMQSFAAPEIEEKNPIGAGDAMVGGIVYELARGSAPAAALRCGLACGAAAAARPGTDFGDRETVRQLMKQLGAAQHV